MAKGSAEDPKGLIYESYRIEGISASECRTIFLDWALSVPMGQETNPLITALLEQYGKDRPDHPMTQVLNEALTKMTTPRRRGGWRGRERN